MNAQGCGTSTVDVVGTSADVSTEFSTGAPTVGDTGAGCTAIGDDVTTWDTEVSAGCETTDVSTTGMWRLMSCGLQMVLRDTGAEGASGEVGRPKTSGEMAQTSMGEHGSG